MQELTCKECHSPDITIKDEEGELFQVTCNVCGFLTRYVFFSPCNCCDDDQLANCTDHIESKPTKKPCDPRKD